MAEAHQNAARRGLTGWMVLVWLLSFFGLVFAVNAVMIRAATSTFGGMETASSYQAGLTFGREVAAAQRQDALQWNVTARLDRAGTGIAGLTVSARDKDGRPVSGIQAQARLIHPADARRDHDVTLRETGNGRFAGTVAVDAGQWDLEINLSRGDERMFRSLTRVHLD
jgi:nitrogen fixation protein FixH